MTGTGDGPAPADLTTTVPATDAIPGPGAVPRRRAGVHQAPVGDDLVLFDTRRWRAHGLNRSAALVWERCDGHTSLGALVDALLAGPATGADPDRVAADVTATVAGLAAEGLLLVTDDDAGAGDDDGGDDDLGPEAAPGTARFVRASLDRPAPPAAEEALRRATTVGPFGALGTTVVLRCADAGLARWLEVVLRPLAVAPTGTATGGRSARATATATATATHVYGVLGAHPDPDLDHLITVDGFRVAQRADDAALATHLVWHVNQLLCSTPTDRLLVHAAAVASGDDAVVLPAVMNAGKSTLVAGLVRAGLDYLTDECASLDAAGTVDPYPRAISLERGSWSVLPDLEPPPAPDGSRFATHAWFVDPDRIRAGAARHAPARLRAFVFPTFAPDREGALEPMPPLEVATELARNAFNLPELGPAGLGVLAHLAETVPAWRLHRRDLDEGVDAVRRVLADPRRATGTTTVGR